MESDTRKSDSKRKRRIGNDLRLGAFLYVRNVDSWKAVNEELGLRPNFDEEVVAHISAIDLLRAKDAEIRAVAFSEAEARAYLFKSTGSDEFRTMENEIEAYYEYLKLDRL